VIVFSAMIISDGIRTGMVDVSRALPVARHVAVPVDAAVKPDFVNVRQRSAFPPANKDRRTRIVFGVIVAIICGNARLIRGDAPTPAVGRGPPARVSLREPACA